MVVKICPENCSGPLLCWDKTLTKTNWERKEIVSVYKLRSVIEGSHSRKNSSRTQAGSEAETVEEDAYPFVSHGFLTLLSFSL